MIHLKLLQEIKLTTQHITISSQVPPWKFQSALTFRYATALFSFHSCTVYSSQLTVHPMKSCAFWCRHHEALRTANAKYKKKRKNYWGHGNVCSLYECTCSLILGQKNQNLLKCTINMLWWQSFSTLKHIFCIGQYESNKWPSRYPSCSQYFSLWTGFLYKKKKKNWIFFGAGFLLNSM